MISFDFPGAPARLSVARVRTIAPFVLLAMPIGWLLLLIAGDFHAPLAQIGLLIYGLGFLACFLIIPTGIQRIAGGLPHGLDEMHLAARYEAQSKAYRWFTLWVLVMALAIELVPPLTGLPLSSAEPAMVVLFLWVIAWSIALPAFFLSRALPVDEDEDAG